MNEVIASNAVIAVIGTGQTGLSVARFLARRQQKFMMLDTRQSPPNKEAFEKMFPGVACEFGPLNPSTVCSASKIVVSPGIDVKEASIQEAIANKIPVVGDIQLFIENVSAENKNATVVAPVIAITGSNGKSTVTTLVGEMMAQAGKQVAVAGNIGTPVLDLLEDGNQYDCYVLELSSFQLETTAHLNAQVAVILNISADHMDRYANLAEYHRAKQRIFFGARHVVFNRNDALSRPPIRSDMVVNSFGLDRPDLNQFGVIEENSEHYLAFGLQRLMNVNELKIRGTHNIANALAALAIGRAMNVPMDSMLKTLQRFAGLPHRCQWIRELNGVEYFNDSKGTNVGATAAAINGLSENSQSENDRKIVLIAGGDGKGADFSPLTTVFEQHLAGLVAIGRDAEKLILVADKAGIPSFHAKSLQDAVENARQLAKAQDIVLLSPACASFDMFKNYVDRGEQFIRAVEGLTQ